MILNKDFLIKKICENIYDDGCYYGEKPSHINDIDELHDLAINVKVNGILIEEYDALYWKMCEIINQESNYMIDYINEFIDEEFQTYYGDPAFASAHDYWNYILG